MTDQITDQLINKLESITNDTNLPLEKRLIDTAIWYHRNKDHIEKTDALRRLDFLEKTFDIFLELIAMQVDRMQMSEGRPRSSNLFLPNGIVDTETGKRYG